MKKIDHDYKQITVYWADHHAKEQGDYEASEVKEMAQSPIYYEFTGYLIEETDECISVGSHIRSDGLIANPMSIMKICILEWSEWDAI